MMKREEAQKWLQTATEMSTFVKGVLAAAKEEENLPLIVLFDWAEYSLNKVIPAFDALDASLARSEHDADCGKEED